VITIDCLNPGSAAAADLPEPLAGYSDLQTDVTAASDVDWYASEFDRIAEQTLGGTRSC